ncbi:MULTISPECIES: GGDEF domain-containing protein [Providencia]|uniref:GGDEF domain-containing protein n=2 Tax=Providencia stuartii TaxID=588 RepID=A0AAI9MXK7_PROST|nr:MULTISPECIES: GGDEF domain-containing protein [unclassified Providencia]ELR5037271.1 GGDEF domain-containing protein [Providencia stuartii]
MFDIKKNLLVKNKAIPLNSITNQAVMMLLINKYGEIVYASELFLTHNHYTHDEIMGYKIKIKTDHLILEKNNSHDIFRYNDFEKELFFINKNNKKLVFITKLIKTNIKGDGQFRYCITFVEVTRLIANNNKLLFQVNHDSLTKVLNRYGFYKKANEKIKSIKNNIESFYLAIIDIDGFKRVNDTLGHQYGDYLLKKMATNIKKLLPSDAILARLGGDEFALMINSHQNADYIFLNLVNRMNCYSYRYLAIKISNISISIGVAQYPLHGSHLKVLLKNADIALYQAKKLGGNQTKKYL